MSDPLMESVVTGLHPLVILGIGIAVVLGMILVLKMNAFLSLITAAVVVSLLAPLPEGVAGEDYPMGVQIVRVADAFGSSAGKIGIVIGLAAVIGTCMMDSGAADRIVRSFIRVLGVKRTPFALMTSGFTLAVPVFFDTVFYLLVPLARSVYKRTGKDYLLALLAIAAGGTIAHTLVPPTPGPLVIADQLGLSIGTMIIGGAAVGFPTALVGLAIARFMNRTIHIPFREVGSSQSSEEDEVSTTPGEDPLTDEQLPSFFMAILPVALPVVLIAANTIVDTLHSARSAAGNDSLEQLAGVMAVVGNANFALLLSTAVALLLLLMVRKPTLRELSAIVETSLMSGGVIILITAAGGAFGAMLQAANVGPAIEEMFKTEGGSVSGLGLLLLGYAVAAVLKVAQGSSTVAMITASAMLGTIAQSSGALAFHPVYLATAIGTGSLMGSWMNDSGFWIFAKMGGLTEAEALKTWTILLAIMSATGFGITLLFASLVPLAG